MASPIIKTSVWSAIACGFVRKKKASVTWKSESEVMIVAAEITAILTLRLLDLENSEDVELFCSKRRWWLYRLEGKPRELYKIVKQVERSDRGSLSRLVIRVHR